MVSPLILPHPHSHFPSSLTASSHSHSNHFFHALCLNFSFPARKTQPNADFAVAQVTTLTPCGELMELQPFFPKQTDRIQILWALVCFFLILICSCFIRMPLHKSSSEDGSNGKSSFIFSICFFLVLRLKDYKSEKMSFSITQ